MSLRAHAVLLLISLLAACAQPGPAGPEGGELDRRIGQMLMTGFRGLELADTLQVTEELREGRLGGVILFDYDVPADTALRNIRSPRQLRSLTRQLQQASPTPLFIAIDQEGGRVSRLKERYGFPSTVPAEYLGSRPVDSTRFYAGRTAGVLDSMGINFNFAPVVDLDANPDNPVIGGLQRAFSADPDSVYRRARAWIRASRRHGVITALKHFFGHGSSSGDSHLGVVDVTGTWSPEELVPYRRLIDEGLADAVMTAHIFQRDLDPRWPATLSRDIIGGVLRDSLGFGGVVVSDDMQMGAIREEYGLETAIRRSLEAGVDLLVFANNSVYQPGIARRAHRIIRGLVEEGTVSRERIDRSWERIMDLKRAYGLLPAP